MDQAKWHNLLTQTQDLVQLVRVASYTGLYAAFEASELYLKVFAVWQVIRCHRTHAHRSCAAGLTCCCCCCCAGAGTLHH